MRLAELLGVIILATLFSAVMPWSPAVAQGEAFIVSPGESPRYGGQQGREADVTELLAT
jgi:hypothetical protein